MSNTMQIGQFRKDQLSQNNDVLITINNDASTLFEADIIYYIPSLYINNDSSVQLIDVVLTGDGIEQVVATVPFPYGRGSKHIELAFVPKRNFNKIILRKRSDTGGNLSFSSTEAIKKENVLNQLPHVGVIKKLGFQAAPGFAFILNGEIIRVGKSGTYMVSDIDIKSIGIIDNQKIENINPDNPIPFNEDSNYFLMDYQYIKEV